MASQTSTASQMHPTSHEVERNTVVCFLCRAQTTVVRTNDQTPIATCPICLCDCVAPAARFGCSHGVCMVCLDEWTAWRTQQVTRVRRPAMVQGMRSVGQIPNFDLSDPDGPGGQEIADWQDFQTMRSRTNFDQDVSLSDQEIADRQTDALNTYFIRLTRFITAFTMLSNWLETQRPFNGQTQPRFNYLNTDMFWEWDSNLEGWILMAETLDGNWEPWTGWDTPPLARLATQIWWCQRRYCWISW